MIEAAREPFARAVAASEARHFAWLYADEPGREALELFLALEEELLATIRPTLEHSVAHARLAWWQAEAERAAAGSPAHPITQAIATRRASSALNALDLRPVVATLAWDLAGVPCPTEQELSTYTNAWARSVFAPLAELLAPESRDLAPIALRLGAVLRELELLALVHLDAPLAAARLPADALAQRGLKADALTQPPLRPPAYDLLAQRHAAARRAMSTAVNAVPAAAQPAWRPLLVWAYCAYHESVAAAAALPAPPTPSIMARFARTIAAWRAALRARAGQFSLPL